MSDTTPNLTLPYIMAAQAQKHVTHNEAVRALDAVVQLAVLDRDLAAPPLLPADGSRYIVAPSPSGTWAGHASEIAAYQDGAWTFYAPREGWIVWVVDEDLLLAWNGTSWIPAAGVATVNPTALVGVNATADSTNRLAVSSPASLLNHEGASHRLKINKATTADTGSVIFQTGFAGHAEMGLTGDDNYHLKVSADGSAWHEAIVIDRSSGSVAFPNSSLGGTVAVEDEGGEILPAAARFNFAGAGVVVTNAGAGEVLVTVPGAGGTGNVPAGGTASQVLAKVSATDFHTQWVDQPGDGGSVAPSYANPGGQGNRTAMITVSASAGLLAATAPASNLVNGGLASNTTDSVAFLAVNVANHWIEFDWSPGASKIITEIILRSSTSATHGTWKVQGWLENTQTWEDVGSSFTLGGATVQTITAVSSSKKGYRKHRLLGVSGTASGAPFVQEIEFKIGASALDGRVPLPPGGTSGQVLAKTTGATGVVGWANPVPVFPMHTDGIISEWHFREGSGTTVTDIRNSNHIVFDAAFQSTWNSSPAWTRRGLLLENDMVQTPVINGVKTVATLYRVNRGQTGSFWAVYCGGFGVLGDSLGGVSNVYHIAGGAGVAPLAYRASTLSGAYRLNRGGYVLVFEQMNAAVTAKLSFGGRADFMTQRVAEMEVVWSACWNDNLTADERQTIYDGARQLAASRGLYLDWRDCPVRVDCVVLWGQSNAEGRSPITSLSAGDQARKAQRNVLIAPGSTTSNGYASPELLVMGENQQLTNAASHFGPEMAAAWMREDADTTRVRQLVINKFTPGSSYLAPSTTGISASSSWNTAELATSGLFWFGLRHWWDTEARLIQQGIGPRLAALWWMQGEQDATNTAYSASYQADLQALWNNFKTYTGYASGVKAVIARIRDQDPAMNATAKAEVRAAQAAFVTANTAEAALIDTDTFPLLADNVHYDAVGMKSLGQAFYNSSAL